MPHCTTCGRTYELGAAYCSSCAAVIPGASVAAPLPAKSSESARGEDPGAVDFPAASRAKRLTAAAIDLLVCGAVLLALVKMPGEGFAFIKRGPIFKTIRLVPLFYMLLRDSIGGKSLGKLIVGLTAYEIKRRRPANMIESIVRNWPFALLGVFYLLSLMVAFLPMAGAITAFVGEVVLGALLLFIVVQILRGKKQRLGDRDAGTQVIEDHWLAKL